MTRLLIRYLLSLFFLFWGGYAHLHHHRCCYGSNKIYQGSVQVGLSSSSNRRICFSKAPPASNGPRIYYSRIKATIVEEEEDEETESSRNHSNTSYYTGFFYAQSMGAIDHQLNGRLPFCEHFSYSSSSKFILHRVIRV